jgi:hypothetical protein
MKSSMQGLRRILASLALALVCACAAFSQAGDRTIIGTVTDAGQPFDATHAGPQIRMGSGEKDLARYRQYGYNAAELGTFTGLATFEKAAPGALQPGSALRSAIDRSRRKAREEMREAKELGLAPCYNTDEILLPTAVLESLGKRITLDNDPKRIDLNKDAFWDLYREKYREVLRDFPEIAYVQVRTGENYSFLTDGYTGQLIAEETSATQRSDTYIRNMQRLINETRKVVVDEFGRKLIWRTWDLGAHGFHANPAVYDRIVAGIPNRKGLILSVKFTRGDFWSYMEFNPTVGRDGVDQIIEFQCAREYEGKGAYPNYLGEVHAEALRRARALGAKGVSIWDFGGGWGGPFLKSDRWVRLNIEATAKLAENPDLSPRELAEEWAAKEFGKQAAPRVADMLMLSAGCVRQFLYIAPYARQHQGWLSSGNLTRDDIIRGQKVIRGHDGLRSMYEETRNDLNEVLEEKSRAMALASRMRVMFESARNAIVAERGEQVYNDALGTLRYMESLAIVMSRYVRGMYLYYTWQDTKDPERASQARTELLAWKEEWQLYRTEIPKLGGAASLYRSANDQPKAEDKQDAMEDTCEKALSVLASLNR